VAKVKITKLIDERNIPAQVAKFFINSVTCNEGNNDDVVLETLRAKYGENIIIAAKLLIADPLKEETNSLFGKARAIAVEAVLSAHKFEQQIRDINKQQREVVNNYKTRFSVK
jgi:hypothetical protein